MTRLTRLTANDIDQEPLILFDATAARLAWERTMAFFSQHLKTHGATRHS